MSESSGAAAFWPAFATVARRPKWIAALLLVLAVAAAFAGLGRWQLERSFAAAAVNEIDTESAVPLVELTEPARSVTGDQLGRVVEVSGEFAPDGFVSLSSRLQHGEQGAWLVGRLLVEGGPEPLSLAVALGWAPTTEEARDAVPAVGEPVELRGRYLPTEPPRLEDVEAGERSALSIADLVNTWPEYTGTVYGGYLIADDAPAGLETIDAPPPLPEAQVNLLNLFYAIEWVVFAGFAAYLWYRLVRDEVEKEAEAAADAKVD